METTKFLDKVSISHNDNKEILGFLGIGYDGIYTNTAHFVTNHTKGELLSCPKDTQIPKSP
jgi:hypothetical protein